MTDQKTNPTFQGILLSLFGFVLLWAVVTDAWGYSSHLVIRYGNYFYASLSRLIWVAPAFWLILRYSDSLTFDKRELFSRPVWNKSLVIVLIVPLVVSVAGMTKSLSRFARNTTDCLELTRKLLGLGVTIFFEKENLDTGSMESELLLSIMSSIAESESVSISENQKWSIRHRYSVFNNYYRWRSINAGIKSYKNCRRASPGVFEC